MDSWNHPAEVRMQEVLTARTVYVNRNFNRANTKVLVNPNFKHSVHINPNFGAKVHVNPSVLHSQPKPPPPVINPAPVQATRFTKVNTVSVPHTDTSGGFQNGIKSSDVYKFKSDNKIILAGKTDVYKINKFQNENKMISVQKSDVYNFHNTNKSDVYKINKLRNQVKPIATNKHVYKINRLDATSTNNSIRKCDPYKVNNLPVSTVKVTQMGVYKSTVTKLAVSTYTSSTYSSKQLVNKPLSYAVNENRVMNNVEKTNESVSANKLKRDFSTKNLKLVKSDKVMPVKNNFGMKSTPNKVVNRTLSPSKYKLIRKQGLNYNKHVLISRRDVNSKYKLVRVTPDKKRLVANKFKLDNRVDKSRVLKQNAKAYLMNVDPQREIIKRRFYRKSEVRKVVKINGVVYRFSEKRDLLKKITRSTKFDASKVKKRIVVNGVLYVLKDSLTYVRKYANNLVKINNKVLRKDNNPCLVFRRTGKCNLHAKGKCIKQHNVKQINICIRFLQGACHDNSCLLSHDVSSEKMPTCKYFLEGCCSNDDCQYLHVKLGKNAEICKDFLEGYCPNGIQCMKKHQFLCPTFEKTGGCGKRLCPYPHGEAVRQCTDKLLNKIARSTKFKLSKKNVVVSKGDAAGPDPSVRYYKEETAGDHDQDNEGYVRKPRVGVLPSFIGFEN